MAKKTKADVGETEGPLHYYVTIPIAGSVTVLVEAKDEDEAVEKAWDKIGDDDADVEWEALRKIASGNVLHAPCNSIEVDLAE